MPVTIRRETNNIYMMHFSGIVKCFSPFSKTSRGERGADWNDLDFQHSHGNEIAKIAIVGEPRWEPEALVFAGAGFRRAPVKFFPDVANC